MLSLNIHLEDAGQSFEHEGGEVKWGASFVAPFLSRHVQTGVRRAEDGDVIWVGEDEDPFFRDRSFDQGKYRQFQDYAGVAISLDSQRRQVRIARTTAGTFPLYLTLQGGILTASWKFEEVAAALRHPRPNVEACRRQLNHGLSRVREQVLEGMFMLWPGESAVAENETLQFGGVDPVEVPLPATFADGARATDAFVELIADALRLNLKRSARPLIELSGGFDSSCVAIAAARIRGDLSSYGVIHDGVSGDQQTRRRSEIISLLGLSDHRAPSFIRSPFLHLLEEEECRVTPYDCPFRIPCVRGIQGHPAEDFDLIMTGSGGDELTMTNTYIHEEWEVAGVACTSGIVAAVGRSDMFMRLGIWPVSPFVHPSVVNFCRSLPQAIRKERILNILALARAGVSDGFLFPRFQEDFGFCLPRDVHLFDFDEMLSESIIADFKIARVDHLLQTVRESPTPPSLELISKLYEYVQLDAVLKTYVQN